MGARGMPCNAPPCKCRRLDCLAISYLEVLQAPPPGAAPALAAESGAGVGSSDDELYSFCSALVHLLAVPTLVQLLLACGGGRAFCDAVARLLVRRRARGPAYLCLQCRKCFECCAGTAGIWACLPSARLQASRLSSCLPCT